jgi:hypothetical protein
MTHGRILVLFELGQRSIQKELRQWFLWRYPNLKEVIESLARILPDSIMEDIIFHERSIVAKSNSDNPFVSEPRVIV